MRPVGWCSACSQPVVLNPATLIVTCPCAATRIFALFFLVGLRTGPLTQTTTRRPRRQPLPARAPEPTYIPAEWTHP